MSVEELTAFFTALRKSKYRALFMTCYAAGLRFGEACHLRVEDIDSRRMVIRVLGKGSRERQTVLSPRLLEVLRDYWREARPKVWLSPRSMKDVPGGVQRYGPIAVETALRPVSASAIRHTACGTVSPRTCWTRAPIWC